MSCLNCYLPQPPRDWSRVQNSCSVTTETNNNNNIFIQYENNMLNKGNVLQYKANSSNLTKQQRYSQIAKGQWVNRNTTWATQSSKGYTNPNTQSLKRVGSVNVTTAGAPTTLPLTTCLPFTKNVYDTLPVVSTGSNPQVIPPPPPPIVNNDTVIPVVPADIPILPIVIQDLGNLICSIQENVCTGETTNYISQQLCNPTTDSDVPGEIMNLCWNDGNATWYPRQRYVMTNSGNKWPVNAVLFSASKPSPPDIISITNNINIITLKWTQSFFCLPVTNFNIYQNNVFLKTLPGNTFTTTVNANNSTTYEFYIIASNRDYFSDPSNIVSINIEYLE
jgi:hypothetical protein